IGPNVIDVYKAMNTERDELWKTQSLTKSMRIFAQEVESLDTPCVFLPPDDFASDPLHPTDQQPSVGKTEHVHPSSGPAETMSDPASETPPEVSQPTLFQATPLPRLGCGGPSQCEDRAHLISAESDIAPKDTNELSDPAATKLASARVPSRAPDSNAEGETRELSSGDQTKSFGCLLYAIASQRQGRTESGLNPHCAPLPMPACPPNLEVIALMAIQVSDTDDESQATPCQSDPYAQLHDEMPESIKNLAHGRLSDDQNTTVATAQSSEVNEHHLNHAKFFYDDPAFDHQVMLDLNKTAGAGDQSESFQAGAVPGFAVKREHPMPEAASKYQKCQQSARRRSLADKQADDCLASETVPGNAQNCNHANAQVAHAFKADCGFQAVGWILSMLLDDTTQVPFSEDQAAQWRALFFHDLQHTGASEVNVFHPIILGGMQSQRDQLQKLVTEHGVAPGRSRECADQLVQALGGSSIQQILASPRPWADLKSRASLLRPPIRIVLSDELKQLIQNKVQTQGQVGTKANKIKNKTQRKAPLQLKADQLEVPHAVFKQGDGTELSQLAASEIAPGSQGVAIVNIAEAMPYFQLTEAVSPHGIALLVLEFDDPRLPPHHQVMKVPMQSKDTHDPLIVSVAVVQLGHQPVQRNVPTHTIAVPEVPNQVIRVLVYKDQFTGQWSDFVKSPVKCLMQQDPFRQLQQTDVIDVWDRQFLTAKLQKVVPDEADMFSVNLRIRQQVQEEVTKANGNNGTYIEPRTPDGRHPDEAYQVVWLPRKTYGEAQVSQKTSKTPTTLVRQADRYGLRVANEEAEALHRLHRPDLVYIQGSELVKYRVGPMPFGSTKQSLVHVFSKWQWKARPLAPQGQTRDRAGVMWIVQAAEPPSHWVFQLSHGDVLISPEDKSTPVQQPPQAVLASSKTIQALQANVVPNANEDPWIHYDPWARPNPREMPTSQVASLETRLEQSILTKMKQSDVAMPDTDAKVAELESRLDQLSQTVQANHRESVHQHQAEVDAQFTLPAGHDDPTVQYANLMQQVETAVDRALRTKGKGAMPNNMRGRGQQLEVVWVQEHSAPVKKPREGEYQPSFHGLNQQHCKWVRQYRRLVNYARLVQGFKDTTHARDHRVKLWRSITTTAGFAPSFPQWIADHADPIQISWHDPPDHDEASKLCQRFHKLLTEFEKALNAQRSVAAKQRRQDDPAVIFQDLRDEKPLPVQMLVEQKKATITELDHDESAVIVHQDHQWDATQPVYSELGAHHIIEAEECKVWLDGVTDLQPGMTLEQENYIGRLTDLFAKFGDEWTSRWDRHLHVEPDRWDPIVQFAELALPKPDPMSYSPITKEEWVKALKSKRKHAATGPDGVSRADLLNLPEQATENILEMLAGIEQGHQWPRQLVLGIVAALAKIPTASQTKHFRPITILPVIFRTWSSIRARQILAHLQPFAPPTCAGSVPGRQAADIWYHIMANIEVAQFAKADLAGGVVDLEKAFNMLPRIPVLEFMRILNVAPPILVAWSRALVSLERFLPCRMAPAAKDSCPSSRLSQSWQSRIQGQAAERKTMVGASPVAMSIFFCSKEDAT
ncbi:unnamed protein product, partial [Cladocopium goreaui]